MNASDPGLDLRVDTAGIAALRSDLLAAEYFVPQVEQIIGPLAAAALSRAQLLPARDAVQNNLTQPTAALTALFLLGLEITNDELGTALPALGADGAAALGLVERRGAAPRDGVRALVDLRPYSARDAAGEMDWWIAADLGEEILGAALPAHHVLGVGGAAKTLAGLTVRDERHRALDLGTGSGIQMLHLVRHVRHVTGTDISARALRYAQFNLALNHIAPEQVDLRTGSMFEPVAGEKFDVIVSNPPFVITPPDSGLPSYDYRTAAHEADAVVENLFTSVGRHLNRGGIAQFLGNWEHRGDQPWHERIDQWLEAATAAGTPLDAWIVQRETQDPAQYAETWLADGGAGAKRDQAAYERAYRAWLKDFASRDVAEIGFGYVLLRRPSDAASPRIRRFEELSGRVERPLGGHIAAVLQQIDETANLDDAQLLAHHFRSAPDVTEERYGAPGAADPQMIFVRQGDGYGRAERVSTWQAAFIGACDGELSAGQICGALAEIGHLEVAQVIAEVLPFLREALWQGFITMEQA